MNEQLMELLSQTNPQMAERLQALSGLMQQAKSQDVEKEAERAERLKRLRARWARMLAACETFRERDRQLAAALGACECWGENPRCPYCHGRGAPGAYDPDESAFEVFVLPVLERTGLASMPAPRTGRRSRMAGPPDGPASTTQTKEQ